MINQKTYLIIIYGLLFVITLSVTLLLFWEYTCFKHEVQELAQVKEAYYQHVDMLKRSLNASMISSEETEENDTDIEKKKTNDEFVDQANYTIDFSISEPHNESKINFQVISDDEEYRLKQIKSGLSSSVIQSAQKVISRRRKISRKSTPRIVRSNTRYAPIRDFVFSWPLDLQSFWLSSLFGPRKRPNGRVEFHHGIDMAAMKGTPVYAAATGKVIIAGSLSGYGNCVMIEHNNSYRTRYGHLHRIHVRVGQMVQTGDRIGSVGDTGLVRKSGRDASHLHFEIYQNGIRVNPLAFLFS